MESAFFTLVEEWKRRGLFQLFPKERISQEGEKIKLKVVSRSTGEPCTEDRDSERRPGILMEHFHTPWASSVTQTGMELFSLLQLNEIL